MLAILSEDPKPVRQLRVGLPDGLNAVVMMAMARDPDHRFQAVDDFAAALTPFTSARGHVGATVKGHRAVVLPEELE